jgi:hypothetical protein
MPLRSVVPATPRLGQHEKRKQALEPQGWNHAQIDRRDGGSRALPTGGITQAAMTRAAPICLSHGGDACVLGAAERVGNALYCAGVYVELRRRLQHAS